jgi:hypothetical protein
MVSAGTNLHHRPYCHRKCSRRQRSPGMQAGNSAMTDLPITGGCHCGLVRYEISSHHTNLWVCHCRECQKQSGSAFGISVAFNSADIRIVSGEIKSWTRSSDSGRPRECSFAACCGARLWHGSILREASGNIRRGSLDLPPDLSSAVHIWTQRRMAGLDIPEESVQFPSSRMTE